ncbi:hypothetical protein M0R45_027658 [Rubus argutus]|uniref:PRA1 family protein n=1 Tax=Rubus argutus TaxID=59490 RepID=A0AAW1X288_RUBAR
MSEIIPFSLNRRRQAEWEATFRDVENPREEANRRQGAAPNRFQYTGIRGVNSFTVPLAIGFILLLQYYKVLGGIPTVMSLSVVIAMALRPPSAIVKSMDGASLRMKLAASAVYLFVSSLATFGLFMAALATCHHCTCKWVD